MAVFNPVKTRTWNKSTPADGDLIDDEFDRQYENFQYLKDRIDATDNNLMNLILPIGCIIEDGLNLAPTTNFKEANAQAISRSSFAVLWNAVHRTVTGANASTDRITSANHGCEEGQLVKFSFTGGGITALTKYYVRNPSANDFQISSTPTGSVVDITASQSGEMIINVEYGFGDGSTTYNVPDRRGVFARGAGVHGSRTNANCNNYDACSVGFEGQDQIQGFIQRVFPRSYQAGSSVAASSGASETNGLGGGATPINTSIFLSDGTNGSPRTGTETTSVYTAVRYKVRVA
uniref:Tail fiber protein n=1 Tax=Leptospira ellisii TaxID=2023197 RepID=A0A2N0BAY0_9LEPT|nr:hypothetical protein [Leptospira ellisii]PJZ93695.1 hypothetical protein CH379_06585 [Leptospira ellisii]